MEIEFKNLGKIKEAKFDLSKNLTVFVGKNNTGKTYAAYGIYGFYNQDEIKYGKSRNFLNNLKLSNNDFEIKEKDNQVLIKLINIQEFKKYCKYYVEYLLGELQSNLGKVFYKEIKENLKVKLTDDFEKTFNNFQKTRVTNKIRINLNGNEDFISTIFDLINELIINNLPIIVSKERSKFEFKISLEKINEVYKDAIISYLKYHINNILISSFSVFYLSFINRIIYFFPIERTSLNVIHKTIIKDYLENNIGSKELNIDSQYLLPEPVISYLTFLNTISSLKNKESIFEKTIQEIEKNIIYGDIKFNHVKEAIEFYTKNKKIPFNFSASSVKSISSFVLYLEYLATKKDIIIIDEPELNLHPDNQRKFARVLCQLANSGIKVIISTHSDYIISEINNMIALHHKSEDKRKKIAEEFNIDVDAAIDGNTIGAYLFKEDGMVESLKIDEFGFSVKSIDDEIDTMNELTYTLFGNNSPEE